MVKRLILWMEMENFIKNVKPHLDKIAEKDAQNGETKDVKSK